MTDNPNWLAEFVQTGSDAAFRELVTRYVDLVYSTALRLVGGDAHRAKDVTQTVFVNLARVARTLPKDVKLGGWLHRDTCFTASTLMRGERRRQARERQAAEMNALQNTPTADYSLVAPVLDEAINELGEDDRTAILLRFFEQHDFRSVGTALGSTEDAARMRVTRALDKLEGFLKRRGITTTSASLGVVLSANAVQAAPVGLALTISTAAVLTGTTLATTATITATKAIAMTALQKTIVAATIAVLAGAGIYEARQASQLRAQLQTLQEQQMSLAEQTQKLQAVNDDETKQLAALRNDNERLNRNTAELLRLRGEVTRLRLGANQTGSVGPAGAADGIELDAQTWLNRVNQLKKWLDKNPQERIPELDCLLSRNWLVAAAFEKFETESDFQDAVRNLRVTALDHFFGRVGSVLQEYVSKNDSQFPADISILAQHCDKKTAAVLLSEYEIKQASDLQIHLVSQHVNSNSDKLVVRKSRIGRTTDYNGLPIIYPGGGTVLTMKPLPAGP